MIEYLLGVDPGLATGMALVRREGGLAEVVWSRELPPEQVAPAARSVIDWWAASDRSTKLTVVCEAYVISLATAKKSQQGWSLEHIGIVKQCLRDRDLSLEEHFVLQKPAVKAVVVNRQLQAVELWHKGGAGHANDALRHITVRLINSGWRDQRLLLPSV